MKKHAVTLQIEDSWQITSCQSPFRNNDTICRNGDDDGFDYFEIYSSISGESMQLQRV